MTSKLFKQAQMRAKITKGPEAASNALMIFGAALDILDGKMDALEKKMDEVYKKPPKTKPVVKKETTTKEFIQEYCDRFKDRYGTYPVIGKNGGVAKRIVKTLGLSRSKELVAAFLNMNVQWYVTKKHSLEVMEGSLNEISVFRDTGRVDSRKGVQRVETADANARKIADYVGRKKNG